MLNNRGLAMVNALIASVVLISSTLVMLQSRAKLQRTGIHVRQEALAQNYAAELLEVFASLSSTEMLTYLSQNPLGPATPFGPYKLCAHINLLDRTAGLVVNVDPSAEMPPEPLKYNEGGDFSPNRYYQVQVVRADTLEVIYSRCNDTAWDVLNTPGKELQDNERLLVTVGVNWVPPKTATANSRNVFLTAMLSRR